jgi:hypothetical protein
MTSARNIFEKSARRTMDTLHWDEMIAYLLGKLNSDEAALARIDSRIIEDPEFLDQLEELETDLIDRYVHGELSSEDALQFERHYGSSEALSKKVDDLRTVQEVFSTG